MTTDLGWFTRVFYSMVGKPGLSTTTSSNMSGLYHFLSRLMPWTIIVNGSGARSMHCDSFGDTNNNLTSTISCRGWGNVNK